MFNVMWHNLSESEELAEVVRVTASWAEIDGVYVLQETHGTEFDVVYHCSRSRRGGPKYLVYDGDGWRISGDIASSSPALDSCVSDCQDLRRNGSDGWQYVEDIREVTWAGVADDDYGSTSSLRWLRASSLLDECTAGASGLQGSGGDCWLAAALVSLGGKQGLREALAAHCSPSCVNLDGKYDVVMYDIMTATWTSVTIDDLLPCNVALGFELISLGGLGGVAAPKPLFFRVCDEGSFWAALIEKAFAKLCGSYSNLQNGMVSWAWQSLTGCEMQHWYRRDDEGNWEMLQSNVLRQRERIEAGDDRAASFRPVPRDVLDDDELWEILVQAHAGGYPMAANIGASTEGSRWFAGTATAWSAAAARLRGLKTGHAYSLLGVNVQKDVAYVELWDPLDSSTGLTSFWSAGMSDDDEEQLDAREEARFAMAFEQFCGSFTSVLICPCTHAGKPDISRSSR
eukprot:TRINITY_DN46635_c0_g1_i1.p1 TRINITY_DN46635_c0_g1~~TRINITY_DN46635_c0_g1_i1.p1  ORF type:complete len:457 (-),score=85.69 TRINITY_DN46635_c0_g1_i1:41-1411(-)